MNEKYDPKKIESKWQKIWDEHPDSAKDFSEKPEFYNLNEFPYPSGYGLHVGHCMGWTASDTVARMKRMQGYNVLFPVGWDAFGLPTENFAIKTGRNPVEVTKESIGIFKKQMKSLGYSVDWNRELDTTDPKYYRWTQMIFLQFYKHAIVNGKLVEVPDDDKTTPRLAYQSEMPINWCPSCKIGLANEEVINGKCERCGTQTERRMQKQWMLRITAYADRLIDDLAKVDYEEKIKTQQTNWIGRSQGTNIKFKVQSLSSKNDISELIEVFTTRADTLFGCTYIVLSPEHPAIKNLQFSVSNFQEVGKYQKQARKKSDLERTELQKDKTGVELKGIKAINPINKNEVSVWVADYVLASYGTGAVMAVPAHDERDWEFAKKYNIPIKEVILPLEGTPHKDEQFRKTITAIVHRKSDNKYLCVKWKEFGWTSLPIGGIEENETPEEAAVRETLEETGYKVKAVTLLGGMIESHFYADNKKVWRHRLDQPVLCELIDEKQYDIDAIESDRHSSHWMTAKEALEKITHPYNRIGLERQIKQNHSFTGYGVLIDSEKFSGLTSEEAKKKITEKLISNGSGDFTVNFKLRDWVFSRQHYWGEPIPILYCDKCGTIPLPESELPLVLPEVENYKPTDTGESPLSSVTDWVQTKCPKCGGKAMRETDTMPNWAGSSWYYLAYALNQNQKIDDYKGKENIFAKSEKELQYWLPVDLYNGGNEHTTLHLLYSRFWHKFLYDLKMVPGEEPYHKRVNHGIILGPDGQKMSKSKGNVINPDEMIEKFGADTLRAYVMFIGPYDQESAWSTAGIQGVYRFLTRVYNNVDKVSNKKDEKELLVKLNQSIVGITNNIDGFHFNTVVSKLMELNNTIEKVGSISKKSYALFLKLLFPVAPHLACELNEKLDNIADFSKDWPTPDENFLINETIEIVVQINGKIRAKLNVPSDIEDKELESLALNSEVVKNNIKDQKIKKVIIVPKKLVSIVIE